MLAICDVTSASIFERSGISVTSVILYGPEGMCSAHVADVITTEGLLRAKSAAIPDLKMSGSCFTVRGGMNAGISPRIIQPRNAGYRSGECSKTIIASSPGADPLVRR